MSSNFIKSSYVVRGEEVRVIQSNDNVTKRLERIAQVADSEDGAGITEAFTEGIDARQVAVLLNDDNSILNQTVSESNRGDHKESVQQASHEASDIIQQANDDAQEILQSASMEAEEIKRVATEEGHKAGYAEGLLKAEKENSRRETEYAQRRAELEEEYQMKSAELEPLLADTISGIYEHIFRVDLSSQKEIVVHLINMILRQIEGGKSFLVHVSKEDYPYVSMKKKELLVGTALNSENIEIIEDFAIQKNRCVIENGGCLFDCGLDTQLEQLRKEIILLSYQKE